MDSQNSILCSSTSRYQIKHIAGQGQYAKVVIAVNLDTMEEVAIKILHYEQFCRREIMMLKAVNVLDPDKYNLVRFIEMFQDNGQTYFVFEKLDMNLHTLLDQKRRSMTLNEIRPIALQLLIAFNALKSIGVVHSDFKPDNVMLVNHEKEPYRVKIIDFGMSFKTPLKKQGLCMQPVHYRAPEVTLGLPCSEAIDMWSLGCMLLFLYQGYHPFSSCEYQKMRAVVRMLGLPADHLLKAGRYTHFYFKNNVWPQPGWWIVTPTEYRSMTGIQPKKRPDGMGRLEDLMTRYEIRYGSTELCDRRAFVSLIQGFLEIDPKRRLTPRLALSHPFLTMVHMIDNMENPYCKDALDKMHVLELDWDTEAFFSNCITDCEVFNSNCNHPNKSQCLCDGKTGSPVPVCRPEMFAHERNLYVKVQSKWRTRWKRITGFFRRIRRMFRKNKHK